MSNFKDIKVTSSAVHLLHRASQRAEHLFETAAAASGLTTRQFIVLAIVAESTNPSQVEISEKSGIDRSTLADLVGRLVDKGLLMRSRTRSDARRYDLKLTEIGRRSLSELTPIVAMVDQQLADRLAPHQKREFLSILEAIAIDIDPNHRQSAAN